MAAKKLIITVIDALAPSALAAAIQAGSVPNLAALRERGRLIDDCVAAFPSVTPVCAASITTGFWQDGHGVPGMCWFDRTSGRFVEYGSSFRAAQQVGIARQLTDTIYNLNRAHLNAEPLTIFERLDDAQVRTAGTTYLIYRGRHRHEPRREGLLGRLAAPVARHPVMGPRELFYADIFASHNTPCTSLLGLPGLRDRHSGCVGAFMVERDLFDFMLLSLPDNDWHSHRRGPTGQVRSLALADAQLGRVMDAGGGIDEFLKEYAMIVLGDHAQAPVRAATDLYQAFAAFDPLDPATSDGGSAGLAICPSQRAAMLYAADVESPTAMVEQCVRRALEVPGIGLVGRLLREGSSGAPEASITAVSTGELRFAPGGDVADQRGQRWCLDGDLDVLGAQIRDGMLLADNYPDALGRLWAALCCPNSGDVLLSAGLGHEFLDLGGQAHLGGGSHGSLHAEDSLTSLLLCGVGEAEQREQWAIADVAGIACGHFGLQADEPIIPGQQTGSD